MAFFGVTKEKISKVYPHPNADLLELAQVEGLAFQFVIKKGQFKAGDEVLYFPIDSLLSPEVLAKLHLTGKLAGVDKNRIKTIRLRGEISQGIVASLDILSKEEKELSSDELTKALGVTKYDPPIQISQSGLLTGLPPGYSAYDIEGADRFQEIVDYMMDMDVVVTEKMEGVNFSCGKSEAGVFVNQRNNSIIETDTPNSFWNVARSTGILDKIQSRPESDLIVYAEFCGPKLQGNIYNLKDHTLFAFDAKRNHKWLPWAEFTKLITETGLSIAPVLFEGKLRDFLTRDGSLISVQEASNGKSVFGDTLREGIVIKPKEEQFHPKVGRLIIKQRSPQYLAKSEN